MVVYSYDHFMERHLGTMGRYQVFLAVMASLDMMTTGNYVMLPVFIASTPPHSCAPPPEVHNCSATEWRNWGLPDTCDMHGKCSKDLCLENSQLTATSSTPIGLDAQTVADLTPFTSTEQMYRLNMSDIENCSVGPAGNASEWRTEKCRLWSYEDSFYPNSAVTEFDLVCDRRGLANSIAAAYMMGRMTGSLLLGWIGDKIGRRRSMMLMTVLTFLAALSAGLAPTVYILLGLRFTIATFDMTRSNTGFIMGVEYLHHSKRAFYSGIWGIMWSFGYLALPLAAYFIQQWRTLLIVTSIPEIFILIAYAVFMPESPRWLMLQGRKKEARAIIEKMAKINNKQLPSDWDIEIKEGAVKTANIRDLVRSPALALVTVVMAYLFFASSFVYFGLSLNTANLAGNAYFNFFVSGCVEIPAYILLSLFYERIKRRAAFSVCLVLAGLAVLLALLPIPEHLSWVVVMFCMLGKFFVSFTFMATWLVVSEVFPTAVRVSGLGITNAAARIGSVVAAYIALVLPMHWCIVVFSLSAILAGLLVLVIPETQGIILPQTVSEGEIFVRQNLCKIGLCNKSAARQQEVTTAEEVEITSSLTDHGEKTQL